VDVRNVHAGANRDVDEETVDGVVPIAVAVKVEPRIQKRVAAGDDNLNSGLLPGNEQSEERHTVFVIRAACRHRVITEGVGMRLTIVFGIARRAKQRAGRRVTGSVLNRQRWVIVRGSVAPIERRLSKGETGRENQQRYGDKAQSHTTEPDRTDGPARLNLRVSLFPAESGRGTPPAGAQAVVGWSGCRMVAPSGTNGQGRIEGSLGLHNTNQNECSIWPTSNGVG
jgi:hypothetical protein